MHSIRAHMHGDEIVIDSLPFRTDTRGSNQDLLDDSKRTLAVLPDANQDW